MSGRHILILRVDGDVAPLFSLPNVHLLHQNQTQVRERCRVDLAMFERRLRRSNDRFYPEGSCAKKHGVLIQYMLPSLNR